MFCNAFSYKPGLVELVPRRSSWVVLLGELINEGMLANCVSDMSGTKRATNTRDGLLLESHALRHGDSLKDISRLSFWYKVDLIAERFLCIQFLHRLLAKDCNKRCITWVRRFRFPTEDSPVWHAEFFIDTVVLIDGEAWLSAFALVDKRCPPSSR